MGPSVVEPRSVVTECRQGTCPQAGPASDAGKTMDVSHRVQTGREISFVKFRWDCLRTHAKPGTRAAYYLSRVAAGVRSLASSASATHATSSV